MSEMTISLPGVCFALSTDDQGLTSLGDEARVQKLSDDLVVMLRVLEGAEPGKGYQIRQTPATIGRDRICAISVKDSRMSRQHAAIFYFEPDFFLKDMASTNGTFLDDKPVTQAKLKNGDKVRLGGTVFEFIVNNLGEGK